VTPAEKGQQTRAENAIRKHLEGRGFMSTEVRRVEGWWHIRALSSDDEILLTAPDYKGILALIEAY